MLTLNISHSWAASVTLTVTEWRGHLGHQPEPSRSETKRVQIPPKVPFPTFILIFVLNAHCLHIQNKPSIKILKEEEGFEVDLNFI